MKSHPVIHFLVFTCFLVVGYTLSLRFYQPQAALASGTRTKVTTEHEDRIASLDNGQRSLLLVGAGEMADTNPHLEGVWLVTYLPTGTSLQLLPIFPSGKSTTSSLERELQRAFRIDTSDGRQRLGEDFLGLLKEHNYWWSGYIVLDQVSLEKAIQLLGEAGQDGKTVTDPRALKDLPGGRENLQNAYAAQVALLQSLCHKISRSTTPADVVQWISLVPEHILTDLDLSQLGSELEGLFSKPAARTCRFPTLEISQVEP
jgi:hypothetical protein